MANRRRRERQTILALAAVVVAATAPARAEDGTAFRIRIGRRADAAALTSAIRGASRRLASESCRGLFREFADAEGRPLQAGLDALDVAPEAYLALIGFYDGAADRRCDPSGRLAFTAPGSRVVRVCPRFTQRQLGDPFLAEIVVLHEMLHSLGLGENPPSPDDITARVAERCSG